MTRYTEIEKDGPSSSRGGKNHLGLNKAATIAVAAALLMLVFFGFLALKGGVGTRSNRTAIAVSPGIVAPAVDWTSGAVPPPEAPEAPEAVAPEPVPTFVAPRHDHHYKSSWCLSLHGWNLICTTRKDRS